MGHRYSKSEFSLVLQNLAKTYRLFGPKRFVGKAEFSETDYIGYGDILSFDELITDRATWFSPKEVLFPVRENLFTFSNNKTETVAFDDKPTIVFLRACDINGIFRLDKIFLTNGSAPDPYYEKRRNTIKFIVMECTQSFETCFCQSMNANIPIEYHAACKFTDGDVFLQVNDLSLKSFFESFGKEESFTPTFTPNNTTTVTIPPSKLLTPAIFENEFWNEYTRRCIACGRCNTSCPTCSCFTMQDVPANNTSPAIRRRRWAGCHVQGFSDMAGGHSFRKKNGERMRFKTMHKVNDFYKRFGVHMCVGCGRCDMVCPEHISFSNCINKLDSLVKA